MEWFDRWKSKCVEVSNSSTSRRVSQDVQVHREILGKVFQIFESVICEKIESHREKRSYFCDFLRRGWEAR